MKINKIALLGTIMTACALMQSNFAMDMYENMRYEIELNLKDRKLNELENLLADTDCYNAVYLVHKDIEQETLESIGKGIQTIEGFWRHTLGLGVFKGRLAYKNETEYLKMVSSLFKDLAKTNAKKNTIDTAQELEEKYWENFNLIKKQKAELNYTPIKHALKFKDSNSDYEEIEL